MQVNRACSFRARKLSVDAVTFWLVTCYLPPCMHKYVCVAAPFGIVAAAAAASARQLVAATAAAPICAACGPKRYRSNIRQYICYQ